MVKQISVLMGIVIGCLAGTASAHVVTVGGMPVRIHQEREAIALAPLFDEWRELQHGATRVHLTVATRDGLRVLRLARADAPPTVTTLAVR